MTTPMRRRFIAKPFNPRPADPGAIIVWDHALAPDEHGHSAVIRRRGVVWSLAPKPDRLRNAVWVTPDERLPGDHYRAVLVVMPRNVGGMPDGLPSASDRTDTFSGRAARNAAYAVACIRHNNAVARDGYAPVRPTMPRELTKYAS